MATRLRLHEVFPRLRVTLANDDTWSRRLDTALRVHLAVLIEPFLTYMIQGRKTIESRFSLHRIAPFERVRAGDLLLLKRSSGPIVGIAYVEEADFVMLSDETWPRVRALSKPLCADEAFWRACKKKRYASLFRLGGVRELAPSIAIEKLDPRPWLVLQDPTQPGPRLR